LQPRFIELEYSCMEKNLAIKS